MNSNKIYTEEQKEVFKFFKILIGLVLILCLMFFLTKCVNEKKNDYKRTNNKGEVQYNTIIVGSILNRTDSKYKVLLIDKKNIDNSLLLNIASQYKSSNAKTPLYIVDLSNELNKSYIGKESHFDADNLDNFKVKGTTLLKVENKKIVALIEDESLIENELK